MNYRISESQKAKLEEVSIPVDSNIDPTFMILLRRDGRGMHIIESDRQGTGDYPIHVELLPIIKEAIQIWEHHNGIISTEKRKGRQGPKGVAV